MGLQFKRGTDSDRLFITPDVGEPIYTTDTKKLYIGDGTTTGGLLVSGSIGDSGDVQFIINEIVDSAYVQARQQDLVRDSAFVTDIVTSPYIQAAQKHYIDSALADYRFMDSNEVVNLIDSAYVQARQDFAYSSLTGAPTTVSTFTNDANYLDSTTVQGVVDAAYINSLTEANIDSAALIAVVDSAYVQARQDYAYSSLTGTPAALSEFTNDTNYLDSITVQGVVDASYIQANQITYNTSDFTDSTYVADQITAAIDALIDGAPGTLDTLNEIAAALNDDDSAYATLIGLINDQLDSAEVLALVNAAYIQANQTTYNTSDFTDSAFVTGLPVSTFTNDANYLDSTTVQGVIDATYIQSNQTTYTNVSEFVNDANYLDSTTVQGVVDASYVQSNQITYNTSDFTDSAFVTGLPVSTFTNDANYLDSTTVQGVVDAAYINSLTEANIDSAALIALVDSAYVQARQAPGTDSSAVISLITATVDSAYVQAIQADIYRDSAFVTGIIDSAYINARVSTVDSGQVLNIVDLAGYTKLDSANVLDILPSGTYRGLRSYEFTADSGDTIFTGLDDNGNTLAYNPAGVVVAVNGILLREADYTIDAGSTITLTTAADSGDEISIWNVVAGGIDSAAARDLIVDGTYKGIRTYQFTADSGDTVFTGTDDRGNTLLYSRQSAVVYVNGILLVDSVDYTLDGTNITLLDPADSGDVITVHNIVAGGTDSALINQQILFYIDSDYVQARVAAGTDSATVATIITETVDSAYVQARQDFAYSSLTGAPTTVSTFTNDANYLDSTTVQGVIDATYIQANQTTYDFLDSAEVINLIDSAYVQARQSNPDQTLNTTDSVTFASVIITGDLQVNGTTTTVNSEDLNVTDHMIYMNAGESAGSPTASIDVGWAANVNDDGSYAHVGMFRDATDNTFKVYEGYTPEPDAGPELNTAHTSFSLAPFAARTLTGQYLGFDSDFNTKTISDLVNDANYLDSITVQGMIDATYIQSNQITYNTSDFTDSAYVTSTIEAYGYTTLDSANVTSIINAIDFVDSSDVAAIVEAYGYSTYDSTNAAAQIEAYGYLTSAIDSTGVIALITANDQQRDSAFVTGIVDSAYIQARVAAGTDSATVIGLVTDTVDSAYIASRVSAGTDSATVQAIVQSLVDSAYVALRAPGGDGGVTFKSFEFTADSGATIFTGADDNGDTLVFSAGQIQVYRNGILLIQDADYTTTGNNTVTLLDASVQDDNVSIATFTATAGATVNAYDFFADSGQSVFSGADIDGNTLSFSGKNILVHVNGLLLTDSNDYVVGTNQVTITGGLDSGDNVSIVAFDAVAVQYIDSNAVLGLIDSAYIAARTSAGTDSATVAAIVEAYGYTTLDSANVSSIISAIDFVDSTDVATIVEGYGYSTFDSTSATNLINAAYIQANQITYNTSDFVDSAYVSAAIDALIDGAPGTLNTLNEIAAALNDDDSAYGTLVGLINAKTDFDSVDALAIINGIDFVDSTDVATLVEAYGYTTFDSADVRTTKWADNERLTMGDGSDFQIYHNGTNSFVRDLGTGNLVLDTNGISIVLTHSGNAEKMAEFYKNGAVELYHNNTKRAETTADGFNVAGTLYVDSVALDSAWVSARVGAVGGGGTDSATVLSLVQGLVDSAYVQARQASTVGLIFETYSYTADSAQTVFSGLDNANTSLNYTPGDIQVFLNGILLVDSDDYTASNGTSITFTAAADAGDNVSIAAFKSAPSAVNLTDFEFTADSAQTAFSGVDDFGNTLSYTPGNILVHLNGILLSDSADYSATNGSSITLVTAADSADILHITSFVTAAVGSWREVANTTYNAEVGSKLIVDTSSNAVTVTLPASPSFGDEVKVIDGTGNAGTNNITINRNSNKILGADSDFTLDVNRAAVDLVYYNAAQGWIISGNS